MTKDEFISNYQRLQTEFPQQFMSTTRRDLIAKYVINLSEKFWSRLVSRMILTNNPRIDIEEAARGERIAQGNLRLAQDVSGALENFAKNISENGIDEILTKFQAKSLWEAIENSKKGSR